MCPLCRKTHEAKDQEESFPLNTDILIEIQKQQVCEKHGKKLDYCCFEGERRIPVCTGCLETDHVGHDFIEIKQFKEQVKKSMLENLDIIDKNLIASEERISGLKKSAHNQFMIGINYWVERMSRNIQRQSMKNFQQFVLHEGMCTKSERLYIMIRVMKEILKHL